MNNYSYVEAEKPNKAKVTGTSKKPKGEKHTHMPKKDHVVVMPITRLRVCQRGIIAFLKGDKKVVQRLSDLGIIRQTEVELKRKAPLGGPIEISFRRTTIAMARTIADNIFVFVAGSVR